MGLTQCQGLQQLPPPPETFPTPCGERPGAQQDLISEQPDQNLPSLVPSFWPVGLPCAGELGLLSIAPSSAPHTLKFCGMILKGAALARAVAVALESNP